MILDHIPKRTRLIVVRSPTFQGDCFISDHVDPLDMLLTPDRLEHPIGEVQAENVLDGLLAGKVIEPKYCFLVKGLVKEPV